MSRKVQETHVTTIEELKAFSSGQVVELPSFAEGQPFYARLKRPSMMTLVKQGKIPNELLHSANSLFANGGASINTDDDKMMAQLFDLLDVMAEATFVEPTYKEIKDAGVELTDEQLMFIFSYSQEGVNALKPSGAVE